MRFNVFLVKMVVGIFTFILISATAGAAGFPERPIQILVGWPVGSVNDILDRAIATPLSKILKQPVIVQNIPGGGGALVLGRVKSEKPDGYTLFQTGLNMYSQIPWTRSVPFDPLKDFAYLAQHARIEHYLVCRSDSPWKTFEELIQYAKKNPKAIKYSTTGAGSSMNIMMEYLAQKENLQWVHVPYSSGVEASTALLGGHVDLAALSMNLELEHIRTGRLRPLICLNEKRMTHLPDLPTVVEKGYDFSCVSSYIWSVPMNTPKDIQKILETALLQAFADSHVIETINNANVFYAPIGSETLTKALITDYEKYGKLMKEMGLGIFKN
jgi:tripartite-type tricarboxylate transporter receptor subunit TctC